MGKGFGALGVHIKNVITYSISPYEQRVFAGFFSSGFPNLVRRVTEELPYWLPGLSTAALVYYFGTKAYEKNLRKNPKDYENDT